MPSNTVKQAQFPLQAYDQKWHDDIAVPVNATTSGTIEIEAAGMMGTCEVAIVSGSVAAQLPTAAKKYALTVKAADRQGGTYTTVITRDILPGQTAIGVGELIGVCPIPSTAGAWIKVDVATDDTAATGKISVVPYFIPR